MKRITARGIIIHDDEVILMYRRKKINGIIKEYYAIPGGHVENGETLEECLIREIKEEFSINIEILDFLGIVNKGEREEHLYLCKWISGNLKLGGEEKEHNNDDNYYEIRRVKIDDINKIELYEENLNIIKKALEIIEK